MIFILFMIMLNDNKMDIEGPILLYPHFNLKISYLLIYD